MNKKGAAGMSSGMKVGVWVIGICLVAILAFLAYGFSQTSYTGGQKEIITEVVSAGGCNIASSIALSATDALNGGTPVTVGAQARVNDQYIGFVTLSSKTFSKGDKVELLLNASDYIDTIVKIDEMACGSNSLGAKLYATDDMTLSIKNDAGTAVLTDAAAGGAVNETAVAAGGSKTWEVEFQGKDKKSSGNLIFVTELGSTANISSVTMSNALGAEVTALDAVPTGLTESGSNLGRYAFAISAFNNAVKVKYYLTVAMNEGKIIAGAVYNTAYSEQSFKNDDGSFVTAGVVDKSGDTVYEDDYDYDFFIASA